MTCTFEIKAIFSFLLAAAAAIAARSPAIPEPIIRMSYEIVSVKYYNITSDITVWITDCHKYLCNGRTRIVQIYKKKGVYNEV